MTAGWVLRPLAFLATAAALAGAQPAPADSVDGSQLSVYVMTMGPGDQIWERFGHNAIGIRDASAGTEAVYNWGVFSFTDRDFVPRFLRGEMRYSVAPFPYGPTVAHYAAINRQVEIQELDLTPAQRVALRDFVQWNALEENKFYHYDYFNDNCSTRVRDALDRVLGGALKQQFASAPSGRTFRDDARRLSEQDLLYPGIDIALGVPSDREMTRWEAMYVPMTVRDQLREIRTTGADGVVRPLVTSERTIYQATRTPEPASASNRQLQFLLAGIALAGLVLLGLRWAPGLGRGTAAIWCVFAGLIGLLLAALWLFTSHVWTHRNMNLLFFNPLWFLLAWWVGRRAALGGTARTVVLVLGGLVVVGGAVGLMGWPQASEQVALLAVPPHLVVLSALLKRRVAA